MALGVYVDQGTKKLHNRPVLKRISGRAVGYAVCVL
jgi:hypothetical protein